MSWKESLRRAASVDPGAEIAIEDVIRLLDGATRGAVDLPLLRRVLGPASPPEADDAPDPGELPPPPIVALLDRAARRGPPGADETTKNALWGALRELPALLQRLSLSLFGAPLPPPGPESVDAALERLTQAPPRARTGGWACPRCGHDGVESTYSDVLGPRLIEVRCPRCGLYAMFNEGDADEARWAGRTA